MIKEKEKVTDPIQEVFEVVQNYKKRGFATILLTIPQLEDILETAGYSASDPLMIDYLAKSARGAENKTPNLRAESEIKTQKNLDKNMKKLVKKGK
jgi:hypothetical protein